MALANSVAGRDPVARQHRLEQRVEDLARFVVDLEEGDAADREVVAGGGRGPDGPDREGERVLTDGEAELALFPVVAEDPADVQALVSPVRTSSLCVTENSGPRVAYTV